MCNFPQHLKGLSSKEEDLKWTGKSSYSASVLLPKKSVARNVILGCVAVLAIIGLSTLALGENSEAKIEKVSIISELKNKSQKEKAEIKAAHIFQKKDSAIGTYEKDAYKIEMRSIEKIDGGVQVFARAWKNEKPVGFGKDGTVEIERFRIFNPPLLIGDPNGDIERVEKNPQTGEETIRKFREDAVEALRIAIEDTIKIVGKDGSNIIKGKVGTTSDTYYASTNDGYVRSSNAAWATARAAATGDDVNTASTNEAFITTEYSGGNYYIRRIFSDYDTSSLGTDSISSASYSVWITGRSANAPTFSIGVSTAAVPPTTADIDSFSGYVGIAATSSPPVVGEYATVAFNALGLTSIEKTGTTKIITWHEFDVNNVTPTTTANYLNAYYADQDGTTNDPKLTIEHTPTASAAPVNVRRRNNTIF